MADPKLQYLGDPAVQKKRRKLKLRKLPTGFLLIVALPTVLAAFYFLLIASPRYVSEARFVVRSSNTSQPSAMGLALNVVGFSSSPNEAFAVHEYLTSRDSLKQINDKFDLSKVFNKPGIDMLSRYPLPWQKPSEEALFKTYKRALNVGYDSTTGISTISVTAFTPTEAQRLNLALLENGETLVNELNKRAAANAVKDAESDRAVAQTSADTAQRELTAFRTSARFIDPRTVATENTQIIATLSVTIAQLTAERDQLAVEAPASPQLAPLSRRIAGLQAQIDQARARMAGNSDSLAPKVGTYEDLLLKREIAERRVTQSEAALLAAQQEANRQKLYLERIVNPNLPDKGTEPKRLRSILTVLLSALLAYGLGWLIWAGVREHRQD